MSSELRASESPRKWRFTWEAQSHNPTLKLFLFDSHTEPSTQCKNLNVSLNVEQSLLLVSWFGDAQVSLRVPVPRVLVDVESAVSCRALGDHIEVKLVLLLPVDHPIVSNFDSLLNLSADESLQEEKFPDELLQPLSMDSDLKSLSSTDRVHFYCRNCSTKLTRRALRSFLDLPSINWREVADNWFGVCCCSFGGISEKLVARYANSYECGEGTCLLNATSVVLCKDDLLGCSCTDWDGNEKCDTAPCISTDLGPTGATQDSGSNLGRIVYCANQRNDTHDVTGNSIFMHLKDGSVAAKTEHNVSEEEIIVDDLCLTLTGPSFSENVASTHICCMDVTSRALDHDDETSRLDMSELSLKENKTGKTIELLENQKSFLNGFLGNVFMARSSNISKDVEWIQFACPQCSFLIGAYPCFSGNAPSDGGVRLFKCYISTCLPVGGSEDIFRKYTLERMFTNQLLESAKDELSFRTVIRELKTKSPKLQVVLLNPDSWNCTGYCSPTVSTTETLPKMNLRPVIKVLFSDCSNSTESQLRLTKEWVTKNQADEVYMLMHQINALILSLESAKDMYPPSFAFLHGLSLSSISK